ncbi:MAG: hypothetical protein PHS98_01880 [Bacilli bacterium]|nr:hypothetical protein [Bacilli bacterium]
MSKLYNEYLIKKGENSKKLYLFKKGIFFIFLSDDAKRMSVELGLKLSSLNKSVEKCGFPVSQLEKYLKFLKLLQVDYEIVYLGIDFVINDLKSINVNKLSDGELREKFHYYQKLLGDDNE